jgi:hypothetical protein
MSEPPKGFGFALSVSLVTAATMAGAVFFIFWMLLNFEPPNFLMDLPILLSIPLGLPLVIGPLLAAGAVWGAATASLVGRHPGPAARTGALSVAGMVALLEIPVHLSQVFLAWVPAPVGTHALFTVVFMIEVALVSGVASARLSRRLGIGASPRRIGTRVGFAGALGFAGGSGVAVALGFVVGEPPALNMVWALHVGNIGAGLAAGWQLGLRFATSPTAFVTPVLPAP